jgi:hypothetical protein
VGNLDFHLIVLKRERKNNMIRNAAYQILLVTAVLNPAVAPTIKGASAAPLQISLSVARSDISEGEPITITAHLKNTSSAPVSIPEPDAASQQTYLSLATTDAVGNTVLFFPKNVERPFIGTLALRTKNVLPGQEVTIDVPLNESGIGALLYRSSPPSLQPYTGEVHVKGVFTVDLDHQPLTSDSLLFIGSITSSDTGLPLVLKIVSKTTGDLDADGVVTCKDVAIVRAAFAKKCGQPGFDPRADVDNSCSVDIRDLALVAQKVAAGTYCR